MPELRKDPISGSWVIFSPERKIRPLFYQPAGEDTLLPENCPFCEGNEPMTPGEIYAVRHDQAEANKPGWQLRVVPNKFPALQVEGELNKRGEGFYDKMNGIGAHEVVIETSSHTNDVDNLEIEQVTHIFRAHKKRILDLQRDKRFKYIQVFKNHKAMAGATISHSHSQIVALPVIPPAIKEKINRAETHFNAKERCIFCDIIDHERVFQKRVLFENNDYIVMSPYAPRLPFELVIYPRGHSASFENTGDAALESLANIFRDTIARINKVLERPAYNLILNNSPFDFEKESNYKKCFHWHIELVPVITGTGGFELGTNSYINSTLPEEAVEILRVASGGPADVSRAKLLEKFDQNFL